MLAIERRNRIVISVRAARTVTTETLAHQLGVSHETIRRDLVVLEEHRLLARVHGGAAVHVVGAGDEAPFADRAHANADAKRRIGAAAAALLQPGQTIVIDIGTTALAVARAIPAGWSGTVATCSLLAAAELGNRRGVELFVCGGRVRAGDLALSSRIAESFFADLHPDVAFLGSGGMDADAGLTDYHFDEIAVRRQIIANAATSWVLADHSKVGRVAQHAVAPLEALSGLITEAPPPTSFAEASIAVGSTIIVAP